MFCFVWGDFCVSWSSRRARVISTFVESVGLVLLLGEIWLAGYRFTAQRDSKFVGAPPLITRTLTNTDSLARGLPLSCPTISGGTGPPSLLAQEQLKPR